MLNWYVDECMISTINIKKGTRELTCGYQNCNTRQQNLKKKFNHSIYIVVGISR